MFLTEPRKTSEQREQRRFVLMQHSSYCTRLRRDDANKLHPWDLVDIDSESQEILQPKDPKIWVPCFIFHFRNSLWVCKKGVTYEEDESDKRQDAVEKGAAHGECRFYYTYLKRPRDLEPTNEKLVHRSK